jgi:hypothetical protein
MTTSKAYADGFAYGAKYGLRPGAGATKYAEGYTGCSLGTDSDAGSKAVAYADYADGYAAGVRSR